MNKKCEKRMVCLVCMAISVFVGAGVGVLLGWVSVPRTIVCGSVAIISTVIEHYLTVHQDKFVRFFDNFVEGVENEDQ